MTIVDERGSKPQKHLFSLMYDIYHDYTVVYEQDIPELGQRFDIFVLELGIAIEYDGRQHSNYVPHFHKDVTGYVASLQRDSKKELFAKNNGIKLIRLDGDIYHLDKNSLGDIIESYKYPNTEYSMTCIEKPKQKSLEKAKMFRQEQYKKWKAKKA